MGAKLGKSLVACVALLLGSGAALASEPQDGARENAWRASQWAYSSPVDGAFIRAAAQKLPGDDASRALEQEWEELSARLAAADAMMTAPGTLKFGKSNEKVEEIGAQRTELRAQLRSLQQDLAKRAPAFADLLTPRILSSAETRALLDADEGLLFIVPAADATYLFAVTRDDFAWFRSADLNRDRIDVLVKSLLAGVAPPELDKDKPAVTFDLAAAHELYRGLVAPADALLAGRKTLMVIAPDSLGTIPLNLLVTDAAAAANPRSGKGWLIDRQALLALPSVATLYSLRCLSRVKARAACVGAGAAANGAPSGAASSAVTLVAVGAPDLLGEPASGRGLSLMKSLFLDNQADTEMLRALPRLPGAQVELEQLRTAFGPRALIREGKEATESFVRTSAQVRSARYLLFSTHGLLASQGGVSGQPGLVLTPPAAGSASALDDGYLSAAEAATLDLSADIVALSACNTAGGSNARFGTEGLAGLARGFFYAGARALLVSHWDVDDTATAALMSQTFRAMDADAAADHAQALRAAMRSMRINPSRPYWSKPRYWAAFSLLGDHR